MAIAFVQRPGQAIATASGTSLAITVPGAGVAVGNRLIVPFCSNNSSGDAQPTILDSKGNLYVVDRETIAAQRRLIVFSAPITIPLVSSDTITVTTLVATRRAMDSLEFSGIAGLDVSSLNPSVTSPAPASGATAARFNPNSLLVGVAGWSGTATGDLFTAGAGFTSANTVEAFSAGVGRYVASEYQIMSAVGTEQADGTLSVSETWDMMALAYSGIGVVLGGTAPGATEGDIRAGGKTITLTAVGDTWILP